MEHTTADMAVTTTAGSQDKDLESGATTLQNSKDSTPKEKSLAATPIGSRSSSLDETPKQEQQTNINNLIPTPSKPSPYPSTYKFEKLAQKQPHPFDHPSITFGPPIIVLLDIVVPCIIYYVWYNIHKGRWDRDCQPYKEAGEICPIPHPEFDKDILGYAIVSFGLGELYILVARVYRLLRYRDDCAPLLSRTKWDLDATSWVYAVAMLCAFIPFVVGSTMEIPILYLYAPSFLMAFLGALMFATMFPFKIPIGINSHHRGSGLRPFIYYAAEDFIAVDGLQDREFRVRYNARYEASKAFRRMFLYLTWWWMAGVAIYIGCVSAIIFTLDFHYAFGASLGVLFAYIVLWAVVSFFWVQFEMAREKKKWEELHGTC